MLIGSDGRLWDGHHRLRIAVRLGIDHVPVELTAHVCAPGGGECVHGKRLASETPATAPETKAAPAPEPTPWAGATEVPTDREIAERAARGLVGYRQGRGTLLHCLAHKPAPASRWVDFHEVTADDLSDGGICVHPRCGRDLLAPWPAVPASPAPRPPLCVCGARIEWKDIDAVTGGWIHSPGSDTTCLEAQPDVAAPETEA
ncbi:hypothetical protein ABTX35_18935 [Streptomyces sp. NPDC096080]|uniref:hypothetical protein n=1 Tax=Streptomyces sp. NPDC096080 TaxID=3156693 RepID=UPI00331EAD8D